MLKTRLLSLTSANSTELSDIDSLQSRAIDLLRFPMAVFVVFILMAVYLPMFSMYSAI